MPSMHFCLKVPLADKLVTESSTDAQITGQAAKALEQKEIIDTLLDEKPTVREKRSKMLSGPINFANRAQEIEKQIEQERQIVAGENAAEPMQPLEEGRPYEQPIGQQQAQGLRRRPRRVRTVSTPAVSGADLWGVSSVFDFSSCSFTFMKPHLPCYAQNYRRTPKHKVQLLWQLLRHQCNTT